MNLGEKKSISYFDNKYLIEKVSMTEQYHDQQSLHQQDDCDSKTERKVRIKARTEPQTQWAATANYHSNALVLIMRRLIG